MQVLSLCLDLTKYTVIYVHYELWIFCAKIIVEHSIYIRKEKLLIVITQKGMS